MITTPLSVTALLSTFRSLFHDYHTLLTLMVLIGLSTSSAYAAMPLPPEGMSSYNPLLQGILYGILLALFIYTLNIYITLKDKTFLFFLSLLLAVAIQITARQGVNPLILGSGSSSPDNTLLISTALNLLFGALFIRRFLGLPQYSPILDWAVLATGLLPVFIYGLLASMTITPPTLSILITHTLACTIVITASAVRYQQGCRPAKFPLIASLILFVPMVFLLFMPDSAQPLPITNSTLNICATAQMIVFTYGLISHIGHLNKQLNREISDRKLADITYRENEQRWRELADSTFEAILIYQGGIIIDANQACDQVLGYEPTQLIGTSGESFIGKDNLSVLLQKISDASSDACEFTLAKNTQQHDTISVELRSKSGNFNQQPAHIVAIRDISERKQHEQQLLQLGYYDSLTGLANRSLFQQRLHHAIDKAQRVQQKHALLFIDLDQFKNVNDSLGHDVGDQLLVEVGKRLSTRARKVDTVARLGGDEFAILIEDIQAPYSAAKVADELLSVMSDHIQVDDYHLMVTPSIGIALYPSDGDNGGELLRKADTAMYHAKSQGRNNYQFYTEALNKKIVRRMDLESELRLAIERNELFINFQPKVNLNSGNIVGAEALLRWQSKKYGLVHPVEFISIAEETGLIWPIGELVLTQACQQALGWLQIYPSFGSIAVNISGIQFSNIGLIDTVASVLKEVGIPPQHLELEITEGAIINNAEEAIKIMKSLKSLGVKLSLDDFGTGYSSLNYLKRFPVDSLKIDRSFVAEIVSDKTSLLIADNIIKLAHDLQLNIVAEGVETAEQLKIIREMGCDELQGYIFSKPLTNVGMNTLLAENHNLYKNSAEFCSADST